MRSRWVTSPRLIPAGAGQILAAMRASQRDEAHPRGCGADEGCLDVYAGGEWLIPAGAGQIGGYLMTSKVQWAHPRGCGADA